jgi:drug/metabolite transporter (DMT)-like permease
MFARLSLHASAALWLAVGLMVLANILLPLQDALAKQLITDFPVLEVMFVRSLTVFALTLAIGRTWLVGRIVQTPLKRFMTIRALVMLAGWITAYTALRHIPLGQSITLYFVAPILVSLAAGPLLGERTPLLQWVAVIIGFVGVVLASGVVGFQISWAVGLALFSACLWAISLLMLRSMSSEESSIVQVAFANGLFVVFTALPLIVNGSSATFDDIAWMMLVGLVGGAGQFALYEAARRVPAPVLATLEYSSILSAFALGYLMFAEVPNLRLWLGAAFILVSGVITVRVERERRRMSAPVQPGIINALHQEADMADATHDLVVNYIAKTRFPFPGQTTWAADYQTLTNVPGRKRAIPLPGGGEHWPDIVILDGTGRVRELGEVEMTVDAASVAYFKAGSELADNDTPTKVRHFFVYVPAGKEAAAQKLLEDNGISYAGVRGFTVNADGTVKIVPFVTKGDPYDHQATDPAAA